MLCLVSRFLALVGVFKLSSFLDVDTKLEQHVPDFSHNPSLSKDLWAKRRFDY